MSISPGGVAEGQVGRGDDYLLGLDPVGPSGQDVLQAEGQGLSSATWHRAAGGGPQGTFGQVPPPF